MLRVLKVLEMAWLIFGIGLIFVGSYTFNKGGWDESKWFFGGALVSGIFFAFRRRQRKKFEEAEQNNSGKAS